VEGEESDDCVAMVKGVAMRWISPLVHGILPSRTLVLFT